MSRFLYLTDSHLGAAREGFCQTVRLPQLTTRLFARLASWLQANPVDFIVHGGDLTDRGTADQIITADGLFAHLDTPTFLCLGNHDLAQEESLKNWFTLARAFFPTGEATYRLVFDHFILLVVAHHWRPDRDFYWTADGPMIPRLGESLEGRIEGVLAQADRPVIVALHAPLNAIPGAQAGRPADIHEPDPVLPPYFRGLGRRYPRLKLVLAGHNHANTLVDQGSFVSMTTAAQLEAPFEARLIEVDTQAIQVRTLSLAQELGMPVTVPPGTEWAGGDDGIRTRRIKIG